MLKELEPLLPEATKVSGVGKVKFTLLLVGGRSKVRCRIGYNVDGVPMLPAKHPLSRLYIREAHEIDHGGINSAVIRSRSKVWVMLIVTSAESTRRSSSIR